MLVIFFYRGDGWSQINENRVESILQLVKELTPIDLNTRVFKICAHLIGLGYF